MYKVLIVDDKPWVLEDIKSIINWESAGFRIVGCASSGAEALTMIKSTAPDVVFSDIEMPDLNGLELLEAITNRHKGILTVFISAYSKFEYVKEALTLGAYDYLLKPVKKEDLIGVLEKVSEEIKKVHLQRENFVKVTLLNYINEYYENSGEEISFFKTLTDAGINVKNRAFTLGIAKTTGKFDVDNSFLTDLEVNFYSVPLGKKRYVFLMSFPYAKKLDENIEQMLKTQAKKINACIGLSTVFAASGNIVQAFNQANIAVEQGFIEDDNAQFYVYAEQKPLALLQKIRTLSNRSEINEFITTLHTELIKNKINIEGLCPIYNELIRVLSEKGSSLKLAPISEPKIFPETYADIFELLSMFAEETEENENPEVSNALIKEVVQYINSNYKERILIQNIAKHFNVNANYLSMLFKSEIGKSFTSYLIDLRLKKAEELLENESLSLYEISEMVGYDDYFHFSKIFKKYKGLSPANYRKSVKN